MSKINVKQVLAALVVVSLLACAPPAAAVPPNTPKEEVVYANLAAGGAVERVTVVNGFRLASAGTIVDYGDYGETVNLSSDAALEKHNGRLTVAAAAGGFYYQGELAEAELPWLLAFSYTLDGQSIAPEQLPGCAGQLSMTIRVSRNPAADPFFFENYALQATVTLDGDKCAEIHAPDATIASVGRDKTLSYIIFSNQETTLSWSAQVRDFTMEGLRLAGISLSFSTEDFDTTAFTKDLGRLQDGIIRLDDGVYDLKDGVLTMNGSLPELVDGVAELQEGVGDLQDGVAELWDGALALRDGTEDLRDGIGEAADQLPEFQEGVAELAEGVGQLAQGSHTFYHSLLAAAGNRELRQAALATAQQNLESALAAYLAAFGNYYGLYGSEQALSAAAEAARQAADNAAASIGGFDEAGQVIAALQHLVDIEAATPAQVEQLGQLKAALAFAQSLDDAAVAAENAAAAVQAQLNAAAAALPPAQAAYEQAFGDLAALTGTYAAAEAARQLAEGYGQFHQGILELDDQMPELTEGVEELQEGFDQLYDGADELYQGQSRFADGVAELDGSLPELARGVDRLYDGVTELTDGVTGLADGITELKDGTGELREETADMDTRIEDKIHELLNEYGGRDFTPRSFVSPHNTQVESLQFVLKSVDITLPEQENVAPGEQEAETVWQRAVALARYWRLLVDWVEGILQESWRGRVGIEPTQDGIAASQRI